MDDAIEIYSDSDYEYYEDDYTPRMVKWEDSSSGDDGYELDPD